MTIWKKEKEMDIQKAKEDWQRLSPDQKEKRKELFRKLNIPIPDWMGEEEKRKIFKQKAGDDKWNT